MWGSDKRELERIERKLDLICRLLFRILDLEEEEDLPRALEINQISDEGEIAMITGVAIGGKGTFVESFVPSNAALPAGAVLTVTWTADDPLVTLVPSSDGTSVVASVAATDTAKAFNLTAAGISTALPGPITSGPVSVPILPAPPPLPTSLAINQTA